MATRCSIATAAASLVGALALLLAPAAVAGRVDIEVAESGDSGFVDEYGIFFHPRSGENNHLHVRRATENAPIFVRDSGASLRAGSSCRARSSRTVRCYLRGVILSQVILPLGDGDDVAHLIGVDGSLRGGAGDDDLETRNGALYVDGEAGADRMFAGGTTGGIDISYENRGGAVAVTLDGQPNDGEAGEGDNIEGRVLTIAGGPGDDALYGGPQTAVLRGYAGNDLISAGQRKAQLEGDQGDDHLQGGLGNDHLYGGQGSDVFRGGPGLDTVDFGDRSAVRASIGDGPNDGPPREGDDVGADVENLTGSEGADDLIGDQAPNRLAGSGGDDILRGGDGADVLDGVGDNEDRDLLVGGPGTDRLLMSAQDRVRVADGERDSVDCGGTAPPVAAADFDAGLDRFASCAPGVHTRRSYRVQDGRASVGLGCPLRSAVRCTGMMRIVGPRRRPIAHSRFDIAPGRRTRLRVRLRGLRPRRGATAVRVRLEVETRRASPRSRTAVMAEPRLVYGLRNHAP
jgi:hypothetical protein